VPSTSDQLPRLIVISPGPLLGVFYELRRGEVVVGRGDEADVLVASPTLSRKHAYVSWDGVVAQISDAESTNGTRVNGRSVSKKRRLKTGDVIQLGEVDLRFETPTPIAPSGPTFSNQFGQANYGDINQVGGDQWIEHHQHNDEPNPMLEIFEGSGPGRFLVAIGLIIVLAGFAGWMYLIFAGGASIDDPSGGFNPFEAKVLGLPAAMLAFGTFVLGGVIASIGYGMSRSAREREERELLMRGRGY
jgi:hypothetical protein